MPVWLSIDMRILLTSQNRQVKLSEKPFIHQCFDHYTEIIIRVHEHTATRMTIYTCGKPEVGTNCDAYYKSGMRNKEERVIGW